MRAVDSRLRSRDESKGHRDALNQRLLAPGEGWRRARKSRRCCARCPSGETVHFVRVTFESRPSTRFGAPQIGESTAAAEAARPTHNWGGPSPNHGISAHRTSGHRSPRSEEGAMRSVEPSARYPRLLDYAEFAQEFLRRNPRYRAEFEVAMRAPPGPAGDRVREEMARPWGLAFPVPARARRDYRARALADLGIAYDSPVPGDSSRIVWLDHARIARSSRRR